MGLDQLATEGVDHLLKALEEWEQSLVAVSQGLPLPTEQGHEYVNDLWLSELLAKHFSQSRNAVKKGNQRGTLEPVKHHSEVLNDRQNKWLKLGGYKLVSVVLISKRL